MSYASTASATETEALTHGQGSMGSRPSQAIFLGNLALALMALTIVAPLIVLMAAILYG